MAVHTTLRRVLVLGKDLEDVLSVVRENGLQPVQESPEVVITYGGDGILLHSEREWPGVPKLPLRNSQRGRKCEPREVREAIAKLARGELVRRAKLRAKGRSQVGLNDVIVHNARPTSSLRCRVFVDDHEFGHEIVGDGVVVATPFGSTAYYRSITRGIFQSGSRSTTRSSRWIISCSARTPMCECASRAAPGRGGRQSSGIDRAGRRRRGHRSQRRQPAVILALV